MPRSHLVAVEFFFLFALRHIVVILNFLCMQPYFFFSFSVRFLLITFTWCIPNKLYICGRHLRKKFINTSKFMRINIATLKCSPI